MAATASGLARCNWIVLLLAVLLPLLSACSSSEDEEAAGLYLSPGASVLRQLETPVPLSAWQVTDNGSVLSRQSNASWRSSDPAIASIDADGKLTAHAEGQVSISARAGDLAGSMPLTVDLSQAAITGAVTYQDYPYDRFGLDAPQSQAVSVLRLQLLDARGLPVEQQYVDAAGAYRFEALLPERFALRVHSESQYQDSLLAVRDFSEQVYSQTLAADLQNPPNEFSLNTTLSAAANILAVYLGAYQFVYDQGVDQRLDLNVFWKTGSEKGTYFCSGRGALGCEQGRGIYVLSQVDQGQDIIDTDEFDDDVLLHEYSHFLLNHISPEDSPGGCHMATDNQQDLRLAWSEGWGYFFASASKFWLSGGLVNPVSSREGGSKGASKGASTSVDSFFYQNGASGASFIDYARPEFSTGIDDDSFQYASNEVAVTNVLWQLYQQTGDFRSMLEVLRAPQWQAFTNLNLESFWDLAIDPAIGGFSESQLQSILNNRGIDYAEDGFEPDSQANSAGELQLDTGQRHTLYRDGGVADEDWFALAVIAGKRYAIETQDLRNGADTELGLFATADASQALLQNDNTVEGAYIGGEDDQCGSRPMNSPDGLASRLVYDATETGSVYVRVRSSSEQFAFAGRYGEYSIVASELPE